MKKVLLIFLGIFVIAFSAYFVKAESTKMGNGSFQSYEQLLLQNSPGVLYLYTNDCKYCVKFAPIFNKLSKEFVGKYLFVKIDAYNPKYSQLCKTLGLRTVPSIYIYEPKTKMMQPVHPYYYNEEAMRQVLNEYLLR